MQTTIVRKKRLLLVFSWLRGLVVVMILFGLAVFALEMGRLEYMLAWQYLHPALLVFALYSVYWMLNGWVRVAEGTFRLAEYGGCGNRLRRIHFGDGEKWDLTQPLNIPLDFQPPKYCITIILVEENFLGWNRIRYRFFSLRYGHDVPPWSSGEEDDLHY